MVELVSGCFCTHNSWARQITRGIWPMLPQMASRFLLFFLHMANGCYYINVVLFSYKIIMIYVYVYTPHVSRCPNCLATINFYMGTQPLRNVPNKIKLSTKKQQRGRLEQKPRVVYGLDGFSWTPGTPFPSHSVKVDKYVSWQKKDPN